MFNLLEDWIKSVYIQFINDCLLQSMLIGKESYHECFISTNTKD